MLSSLLSIVSSPGLDIRGIGSTLSKKVDRDDTNMDYELHKKRPREFEEGQNDPRDEAEIDEEDYYGLDDCDI